MKLIALLLTAGLMAIRISAEAADLTLALGSFDVNKSRTGMGLAEYRFSSDWAGFRPQAGFLVTEESGAYLYGGAGYPLALSEHWLLTPSVSGGYYSKGAGKDLGYDIEFYSQLRLEYRFAAGSRIGLGIGHVSNATLGERNPGAETVYLSYSIAY